ncbi:putative inner membrane protein [compost metagenome]
MELLYGLLVGIGMGALIQRVRASSPAMIASNLRLENLSIIKFMALTIAVGAVGASLLSLVMPMHVVIKPTYVLGVLGGGLLFGIGFALAGYCPGTCVVGAAEGRKDALFTLLGGVVGAGVFTLAYPWIEAVFIRPLNFGKLTLADLFHAPALAVAIGLALILLAVVTLVPTRLKQLS